MTTEAKAAAGKRGDAVRSDCWIEIDVAPSGGLVLEIESKVSSMFGKALRRQLEELAAFFEIENATIRLEDKGALPYAIDARFEAAVKRLDPGVSKEKLPPALEGNQTPAVKERFRRTRLYLPGSEPKFFVNAGLHGADALILDLEDSVAPSEKHASRYLVRNALHAVDFRGAERMVRINQLPLGLDDVDLVAPRFVETILLPKCESSDDVRAVEERVAKSLERAGVRRDVFIMPIVESALGVERAYEIASASEKVCALAIGLEDYTADIGARRTNEGTESFYARTRLVNAAKAARVQAIDTVFSDVADEEGLRASVEEARSLGFEGKGCVHPGQIAPIHEAFAPKPEEIERAKKIVLAFDEATRKGLGAVSLGSKMIDPPVVKRAQRVVELATRQGLLPDHWKENE
jgi:citrate lyase subunit beta/citryl-CoA lyase